MIYACRTDSLLARQKNTPWFFCCRSLLVFVGGLVAVLAWFSFLCVAPACAKSRFEPWDDRVFIAVGKNMGEEAAKRLRGVHDLIINNQDRPLMEKLVLVNDYVNNFAWIADHILWNKEDYWASPFETITSSGGDCEDIAIAKYGILRMMGIPDEKLGLAYVKNVHSRKSHMVLLYMENPEMDTVILDNEHPEVLSSKKRIDLLEVYLFQNDGTMYLIDDGKKRLLQAAYAGRKLLKWAKAMEREKKSNMLYGRYNHGRPLLPE